MTYTMQKSPLYTAFIFFLNHAGYSYDPARESAAAGRRRCALALARAERDGRAAGLQFFWSNDWSVGNHKRFYGDDSAYTEGEPSTCESCVCVDENGRTFAALGCIDDADENYRRVIEAELASEALAELQAERAA